MPLKIDAHHHFWDLSRKEFDYRWLSNEQHRPINRTFLQDTLEPHLKRVGIDQTILVQTQHLLAENDWAIELAQQASFVAGIVGWIDLASNDAEEQILRYKEHPKIVGIRHV